MTFIDVRNLIKENMLEIAEVIRICGFPINYLHRPYKYDEEVPDRMLNIILAAIDFKLMQRIEEVEFLKWATTERFSNPINPRTTRSMSESKFINRVFEKMDAIKDFNSEYSSFSGFDCDSLRRAIEPYEQIRRYTDAY